MSPRHRHLPDTWGWCTREVTEIVRAHTGPSQVQIIQHREGGEDTKPTPYQAATYNWFLLEKGKQAFSKGVSLALSTALHARPCTQEKQQSSKRTAGIFVCFFCFNIFFLPYWVILLLFVFVFGLGFLFWFFRDGKRKKIKLGGWRQEDLERSWRWENTMIQIYFIKKFKINMKENVNGLTNLNI